MTSQVLYRKWRPQRLEEVVGQPAVTQTLRYALATGRVAHAYLFCGPRGTGKTSTARILAKAINCLDLQEGEPCNRCALCRDVNEGEALDIIEMDAASNRGIDEIRSLRERVHYSPTQGKHKTYIIDEVHMLTEAAFNALLKTLEEPPPHVILVLATTDPQKVPATVISRCQRFDFRRISQGDTAHRLAQICEAEGVETEVGALEVIARSAWGSLRDATNILEQVIISYGSPLQASQVRELLGMGDDESALRVVACALEGDVGGGLSALNAAASQGMDLRRFHRSMVEYLRAVLLLKANSSTPLVDYPVPILEGMTRLAVAHPLARIYRVLKSFAQASLRQESPSPLNLELALVESSLAQEPATPVGDESPRAGRGRKEPARKLRLPALPSEEQPTSLEPEPSQQPTLPTPPAALQPQESRGQAEESGPLPVREGSSVPKGSSGTGSVLEEQWTQLLRSLRGQRGKRFFLDGLLRGSKSQVLEGNCLTLGYTSKSNMDRIQQEMEDPAVRQLLAEAVQRALGTPLEVRPVLLQQEAGPPQGHLVRTAQRLGGRVIGEEEITPTGEEA